MERTGERVMPISPEQAPEYKREHVIPDDVFEVFNKQIGQNLSTSGRAKVIQNDVVNELVRMGYSRGKIFDEKWLDVEPYYEEAGWEVKYDKAVAWGGDTYDSYFVFKSKSNAPARLF